MLHTKCEIAQFMKWVSRSRSGFESDIYLLKKFRHYTSNQYGDFLSLYGFSKYFPGVFSVIPLVIRN